MRVTYCQLNIRNGDRYLLNWLNINLLTNLNSLKILSNDPSSLWKISEREYNFMESV